MFYLVFQFIPDMKKTAEFQRFLAGDERIELPLRVLETPVIPFDQSPVPVPDLNRSLDIYITAGSILSIVILKKLLFYSFAKTEKISQKKKPGAYVIFPWNIKEVFGRGRVKVHAEFDGIPYDGSIVNMGVKDADGNVCYIIGVLKAIRTKLGKKDGDSIHVVVKERE